MTTLCQYLNKKAEATAVHNRMCYVSDNEETIEKDERDLSNV